MFGASITAGITLFIVALMYKAAFDRRAYLQRIQRIGMTSLGTVIDVEEGQDSDGDKTYAPVIGYTTHDGTYRSHKLPSSSANNKKMGQVLLVTYDPARPEKPEIGLIHPERVIIWVTVGAVVVIAIGVLIALTSLGVIQSSGDTGDDAALLLPFPIVLMGLMRIKAFVQRT